MRHPMETISIPERIGAAILVATTLAVGLIGILGWQHALIALGIFTLLMIPCAFGVRTPPMDVTVTAGRGAEAIAGAGAVGGVRPS